jgi:hypothetical protein
LTEDEREIATEMTLQAFRAASDALAFRILERVGRDGAAIADLERAAGLRRLATLERITQLVQAGLVRRAAGTELVEPTRLGLGVVGLIDAVRDRFQEKIHERLPALRREGE